MPDQSHGIPRLSVSVLQSQSWQSFSFSQQHLISLCACTYIIHTHLYTYMTSISRWRASLAAVQKAKQNSFSQHGRTQHCKCYQKKIKKIYIERERVCAWFSFLNFLYCLRQRFCSYFALPKSSPLPKIHCSIIKDLWKKQQISYLAKASLNIRNLKFPIPTVNWWNKDSKVSFLFLFILIYKSIHSSLIQSIWQMHQKSLDFHFSLTN